MAITFPSSPSSGDIFTSNGKSWQYINGKWEAYGEIIAPDVFSVDAANDRVGINNTSPTAALDVVGDVNVATASGDGYLQVLYQAIDTALYTNLTASEQMDAQEVSLFAQNPNTETSVPLRLTGSTVSVVGDLNVDEDTLFVDASTNRVGVGTSSPASKLDVAGNAISSRITLDRDGEADPQPAIEVLAGATTSATYNYFLRVNNDAGAGRVVGFVNGSARSADGGPGTFTLRNDAGGMVLGNASYETSLAGRVKMPNQPSFKVYNSTPTQINNPTPGLLVFNNASYGGGHNIGNHYNTSTGLFTAPIAGVYHFAGAMLTNNAFSSTTYVRIWWRLNGVDIHHFAHNHTGAWLMEGGSVYLNMAANDTLGLYIDLGSGHYGIWSYFSGRLVG